MDFREFSDVERMESFADSMFTALRKNKIGNLIIDLRKNGGGNSSVGDRLLRYITPEPYMQMDKALVKITPLTKKLMKAPDIVPTFMFWEATPDQYIVPRTADEGHYDGNVYLLTSNKTFSSAGSFAWAFKECGMGTVIGEETGGMNVCFGDVLTYRMPVSRLQCSVSFKRFWQFRADENNIHGTIPDIAVPAAKAMDTALKLAKKSK
ncbi:S41 family peptidase [uncultured Duncaniella sp.]|nr:S41 family peptidase [uncultured Duncaniella sp.]